MTIRALVLPLLSSLVRSLVGDAAPSGPPPPAELSLYASTTAIYANNSSLYASSTTYTP